MLCIDDERVVSRDNTVRCDGRVLEIAKHQHRRHFVKAAARVLEYPDGRLDIVHGPRLLAR